MIRIWGRPTSVNVQKVMWAIGELGVAHERVDVGRQYGGLDTLAYGALNPNRRIPTLQDGDVVLWLDVASHPVNVLGRQVLADLDAGLDRISSDESVQRLYLASAKGGGFCAGADVHEFVGIASAEQASALAQAGQQLFDKLAALRVPTVALLHGACLGGGLELALACDYRVALEPPHLVEIVVTAARQSGSR